MIRVKISDFGVIQKLLAGANVTFFQTNDDGSNSGILAFVYEAAIGTELRNNPQTLDENGQLSVDCFVDTSIMCEINNISDLAQRQIKKIKANPLDYALPVTNSTFESVNVIGAASDAAASAAAALVSENAAAVSATTATTQAGIATTQAGISTTQAGIATTQAGLASASATAAAASASGFKDKGSVRASTTAALPSSTYNNGASGVGATITSTTNNAFPSASSDTVTLVLNDLLLVQNQAAPAQNGIYRLSQVGTGSVPWILTRVTNMDVWAEVNGATVVVEEGATLADSAWLCSANTGGTMGTTSITWIPFPLFIPNASIVEGKLDPAIKVNFQKFTQNIQSANYTLVLADAGQSVQHPSSDATARTTTIPANASVPFPIGTMILLDNDNGAGVMNVAITTDTLRQAGSGLTGPRAIAANGFAIIWKVKATEWKINGVGVS